MRRSLLVLALGLAFCSTGACPSQADSTAVQTSPPAVLEQAQKALESGEIEAAATLFAEFRSASPNHPAGWLGGGLAAEAAGDLVRAAEYLGRAAALDSKRASLHLTHGRVLARLGSTAPALTALERARRLDPADPDGYLFAALLLRGAGQYAEAEALLRTGIEDATSSPELWDQLGLALLSQRKADEALSVASDGLGRFPASARLELVRGLALAQDRGQDSERRSAAIESLEQAISAGVGGSSARVELAELLLEEGRLDVAITRLEEAVEISPTDPKTHYHLGLALQRSGRRDEAAAELTRFRELTQERNAVETRAKHLGQLLNTAIEDIQANRLTEALTAVEEVLAQAPDHARTLAIKAKILFSTGDVASAYRAAVAAREADPARTEHHYLEGLFAYHLGKLGLAEEVLERTVALDPELGEAHALLAAVALNLTRPSKAVAHFERAIALGVDNEELRQAYALALEANQEKRTEKGPPEGGP